MTYQAVYQRLRKLGLKKVDPHQIEVWLNIEFEKTCPTDGNLIQTMLEDNKIKALGYAQRFNKELKQPKTIIDGMDYWNLISCLGVYTEQEKKSHCINILGMTKSAVLFRALGV